MADVIQFRKATIFSTELRHQLEQGVTPLTEKPAETVNTLEQVICAYLVQKAREAATHLGKLLASKVTTAFESAAK